MKSKLSVVRVLLSSRASISSRHAGFSLVEVLVSMVILSMILLVITSVIGQTQRTWKTATATLSQFREARVAFETVAREMRQATMKSYYDYEGYGAYIGAPPQRIVKKAEGGLVVDSARVIVTGGSAAELPGSAVIFQVPAGAASAQDPSWLPLQFALCKRAYFVQYSDDSRYLPSGLVSRLPLRYRYRLVEYSPPTDFNDIYDTSGSPNGPAWTSVLRGQAESDGHLRIVADNIVALIVAVSPRQAAVGADRQSLAQARNPFLLYKFSTFVDNIVNGRQVASSMPAMARLVMVAVDEESAVRMTLGGGSNPPDILGRSGATFTNPQSVQEDVETLRAYMLQQRYNFRIFSSNVYLPANQI
ncbi:MAG: prepilin-type N-terminal cleavage/methylation domain-containing protein [Verrucomicrobiaceae bacterium]|nr:prepilin-type N-terminal cleavage/methylation domain-containing protein [Verrucomicrobiaceae bacterium]